MMGARITCFERLFELAKERQCVVSKTVGWCTKHRPAAFVIGLPCRVVHRSLASGLYVYQKNQKGGQDEAVEGK